MKHDREQKSHIDDLMPLILFGIFAVCILGVLLTGANTYQRLSARNQETYQRRTCAQYVATKVRQAPDQSAITLVAFGDGEALRIPETIEGEAYQTLVYSHDGWMKELFCPVSGSHSPEDGEQILEVQSFAPELEDGLLTVGLVDPTGTASTLSLAIRDGEEAGS